MRTPQENINQEFGEWVRVRRVGLKMTQGELAGRVGFDVTYVCKIENEGLVPRPSILEPLCRILGGDLDRCLSVGHVPVADRSRMRALAAMDSEVCS